MVTGFLHSSAILGWSTIFDCMGAVYSRESANASNNELGPSYGPFSKACKSLCDFCAYFIKFIFTARFGPYTFIVRKIPIHHFNPYKYNSVDCIAIGQTLQRLRWKWKPSHYVFRKLLCVIGCKI